MVNPQHPYFDTERPAILAHRGSTEPAQSNTIDAFSDAVLRGATHIETDARASRDGIAMLVHDPTLVLHGKGIRVNTTSSDVLAALDLGAGQGVPSLANALAALPTARFNIDVKSRDAIHPVAKAVVDAGAQHRVLITSFSSSRRRSTIRAIDRLQERAGVRHVSSQGSSDGGETLRTATSAGGAEVLMTLIAMRVGLGRIAFRYLAKRIDAFQVPERAAGMTVTSRKFIDLADRYGMHVHVWTINDRPIFESLRALGVDGFTTDSVQTAVDVLRKGKAV